MRMRLSHLLALSLVALVALPAAAGAVTFGADLSQPVSTAHTCANSFGASSCLGYAVTPTSYAPMSGIVTAVRVKTGNAPQGPMQVVVLRSFYQNNLQDPGHPNFFCCFLQEYGPTFTPAPNAVTTVPVTLGMVEDPTPAANDGNTVAKGDFLGLAVLGATTPIPVAETSAGYTGFYAPAPQAPGNPPAPSPNPLAGGLGAYPGYMLMLSADIDPLNGGGPTPAPVPPGGTVVPAPGPLAQTRPLTIGANGGRLRGDTASVPLVCRLTTLCTGTLVLQDRKAAGAAAAGTPRKPKRLGATHFSVAAGKKKTVKVKLNAAGRRLARHRHRLTAYAIATVGGQTVTTRVTLEAPRR
jgi:hypothetical protein